MNEMKIFAVLSSHPWEQVWVCVGFCMFDDNSLENEMCPAHRHTASRGWKSVDLPSKCWLSIINPRPVAFPSLP